MSCWKFEICSAAAGSRGVGRVTLIVMSAKRRRQLVGSAIDRALSCGG